MTLKVDIQHRELQLSDTLNEQHKGVLPQGAYVGFDIVVGMGLSFTIDDLKSVALVNIGDKQVVVRLAESESLTMPLGSSYLVLKVAYKTGVYNTPEYTQTTATLEVITGYLETDGQILLASLYLPSGTTQFDSGHISLSMRLKPKLLTEEHLTDQTILNDSKRVVSTKALANFKAELQTTYLPLLSAIDLYQPLQDYSQRNNSDYPETANINKRHSCYLATDNAYTQYPETQFLDSYPIAVCFPDSIDNKPFQITIDVVIQYHGTQYLDAFTFVDTLVVTKVFYVDNSSTNYEVHSKQGAKVLLTKGTGLNINGDNTNKILLEYQNLKQLPATYLVILKDVVLGDIFRGSDPVTPLTVAELSELQVEIRSKTLTYDGSDDLAPFVTDNLTFTSKARKYLPATIDNVYTRVIPYVDRGSFDTNYSEPQDKFIFLTFPVFTCEAGRKVYIKFELDVLFVKPDGTHIVDTVTVNGLFGDLQKWEVIDIKSSNGLEIDYEAGIGWSSGQNDPDENGDLSAQLYLFFPDSKGSVKYQFLLKDFVFSTNHNDLEAYTAYGWYITTLDEIRSDFNEWSAIGHFAGTVNPLKPSLGSYYQPHVFPNPVNASIAVSTQTIGGYIYFYLPPLIDQSNLTFSIDVYCQIGVNTNTELHCTTILIAGDMSHNLWKNSSAKSDGDFDIVFGQNDTNPFVMVKFNSTFPLYAHIHNLVIHQGNINRVTLDQVNNISAIYKSDGEPYEGTRTIANTVKTSQKVVDYWRMKPTGGWNIGLGEIRVNKDGFAYFTVPISLEGQFDNAALTIKAGSLVINNIANGTSLFTPDISKLVLKNRRSPHELLFEFDLNSQPDTIAEMVEYNNAGFYISLTWDGSELEVTFSN